MNWKDGSEEEVREDKRKNGWKEATGREMK